ncbi:HipA domain-containing protein [Luteimonas sp. FCS-9]|uniref:HipA domain-containing protein n=1 Tax=Luteimonas sp. FCS-9 TaxID=1547516 RepID=UPI001E401150|nr:HipA domain-containing protein [Luteimonas sp. FCS-9]
MIATLDGQPVGTLHEHRNVWRFAYAPAWIDHPASFDLSPWLPRSQGTILDGSTSRPVQWYFDNLLPEDQQRTRMAQDAGLRGSDDFALLAHYGAESAGALTLLPPHIVLSPSGRTPLPDADLSQRIRNLPRHSLAGGAEKRMSLAGAQHKLAVIEDRGALYQPIGAETSTHVLKPDSTDPDYPHTVINEYFVMRLAHAMGLMVPRVQRRYVPEPVFLVERFDRVVDRLGVRRVHAIDACQLLNLQRGDKYAAANLQTLGTAIMQCRKRLNTRTRLFDWLVFNLLTGNDDAHLKNLSFLVDADGIDLAPHYDLLSTVAGRSRAYKQDDASWPHASTLASELPGARRFAEVTPALLVDAAVQWGLPPRMAQRRLADMVANIVPSAESVMRDIEVENVQWAHLAGMRLQGELRMVRTIIEVVIKDMARQLTA